MACDFHTHRRKNIPALLSSTVPVSGVLCSREFHPWYLPAQFSPELTATAEHYRDFAAVGEIGLDRLRGPVLEVQKQYFQFFLQSAADAGKPVVLHLVRTFSEAFIILRNFNLRVMIHGFRGSAELLETLWQRGYTVSFHPSIVRNPVLLACLRHPAGAFGFESDDSPIEVGELLAKVSLLVGRNLEKECDASFYDFIGSGGVHELE